MKVQVGEFLVEVTKKNICSCNLRVNSKGEIKFSCPKFITDRKVKEYLQSKYTWIKLHAKNQERLKNRFEYLVDNKVKIFSKEYNVVFSNVKGTYLTNDSLYIYKSPKGDANLIIKKFLKELLNELIIEKLSYFECCLNLKSSGYSIKNMISRWGSCNVKTKKLSFSLQLVKYPITCVEMVIVHELAHILYPKHDKKFYAFMDKHYPNWNVANKLLKN